MVIFLVEKSHETNIWMSIWVMSHFCYNTTNSKCACWGNVCGVFKQFISTYHLNIWKFNKYWFKRKTLFICIINMHIGSIYKFIILILFTMLWLQSNVFFSKLASEFIKTFTNILVKHVIRKEIKSLYFTNFINLFKEYMLLWNFETQIYKANKINMSKEKYVINWYFVILFM